MSRPPCSAENRSIASATKPRENASRARSIRASRLPLPSLVEDPTVRSGERRVAEERPGTRCGEVELGRGRPRAQQPGRPLDRQRDARHHRVAVLGVPDRVLEDVLRPERPELTQQEHPAVEGARHARRQEAGARDELVAELLETLDRGGRRRRPLGAEDERLVAVGAPEDGREVAARAVEVRLDDLERETGGDGGVERVPAAFEHCHARGRGEPVGGRDHPEGAAQLWASGEGQSSPAPASSAGAAARRGASRPRWTR